MLGRTSTTRRWPRSEAGEERCQRPSRRRSPSSSSRSTRPAPGATNGGTPSPRRRSTPTSSRRAGRRSMRARPTCSPSGPPGRSSSRTTSRRRPFRRGGAGLPPERRGGRASVAFGEAARSSSGRCPHVDDPRERAARRCPDRPRPLAERESAQRRAFLRDGIDALEELGESVEALASGSSSVAALGGLPTGPRPARVRDGPGRARGRGALGGAWRWPTCGSPAFTRSSSTMRAASSAATGVEIAERAGAEFERVWALGFVALGLLDSGEIEQGFEIGTSATPERVENELLADRREHHLERHLDPDAHDARRPRGAAGGFDLEPRSQSGDAARGLAASVREEGAWGPVRLRNRGGALIQPSRHSWLHEDAAGDADVPARRRRSSSRGATRRRPRCSRRPNEDRAPGHRLRRARPRSASRSPRRDTTYAATLADEIALRPRAVRAVSRDARARRRSPHRRRADWRTPRRS